MKYGAGHIEKTPHGTFLATINKGGSRLRRTFKSKLQARAWIDHQAAPTENPLTATQIADAQEALALLPPGASLTQIVREHLTLRPEIANPQASILPIFQEYINQATTRLRPRTIQGYRIIINQVLATLDDNIKDYTRDNLIQYLNTLTPSTRNATIRTLSAFFTWATREGHLTASPLQNIPLAKTPEPRRTILTIPQVKQLLTTIAKTNPRLLHYAAICLFAGLRPEETMRLKPENIGEEYITLTADITKTSQARTVPIRPNLRAFLQAHPLPKQGPCHLSESRFRKAFRQAVHAAGIQWDNDIMRHTFASYAYEQSRDAAATAYEMGHRGTDVFFRHYRGLVNPGQGAQYFAIPIPKQ